MPLHHLPSEAGDSLSRRVHNSIRRLGYADLNRIECTASGSHVTLHGRLPSYYMKQVAQTVAMKVAGVTRVDNQLEVISREPTSVG